MTEETYLVALNIIGLVAFSFSGAIKARIHGLDLFGVIVLGFSTALGGGAIRDVMVQRIPLMLTDISYAIFSALGIIFALALKKNIDTVIYTKVFLVSDAIGLASFTATGCIVAYQSGLGAIGIIVLGVSTAIGGGIIRDIFVNEIPIVLNRELYATCSFAGCIIFRVLCNIAGTHIAAYASVSAVFIFRLFAIIFKWNLPKFS
ncbi:MAG: trimeric intracellular cation channel family protein [Candidatus Omnitrophica bacterium]|nr:trimeric intracellular cation channel family protein [Candidatus Omnitrophota bacterium]